MSAERRPSGPYPCVGDTYLGWGTDEDGILTVTAECDGGIRGDCGCPRDEEGVPFSEGMYDGGCPLHSPRSVHAASEVQGS